MSDRLLSLAWSAVLACFAMAAAPVVAAPPVPPQIVSYQGVLLDDVGQAQTGSIDLTLRVYDAISGGTLLYLQSFPAVLLSDGVFHVALGPTGAATDPSGPDPLTTSLASALAEDLAATGPDRFLEVTAGTETALARSQVLTVPFALRAERATIADFAVAADATTVGGLSSSVVTEIFEHTNLDGVGPDNDSPSEGLDDPDGDGVANFVDPDNDNDGLDDGVETAQGSDINVITPAITSFSPPAADGFITSTVTVAGTSFEPGMSVVFGAETPTPTNVTANSFDVQVGPQPVGATTVAVTRLNGESTSAPYSFFFVQPLIVSFSPASADGFITSTVTVTGTGFQPGMSVLFGTENPVPTNVTPTSFDVEVGPQPPGLAIVAVTLANGEFDGAPYTFFFEQPAIDTVTPGKVFASSTTRVAVAGSGFDSAMAVTVGSQTPTPINVTDTSFEMDVGPQPIGFVDVTVDHPNGNSRTRTNFVEFIDVLTHSANAPSSAQVTFAFRGSEFIVGGLDEYSHHNGTTSSGISYPSQGINGQLAVSIDPSGTEVGLRCVDVGSDCDFVFEKNTDGSGGLEDQVILASGGTRVISPSIAFDNAGNPVLGFIQVSPGLVRSVVAHDRDGDGAFTGTNEFVEIDAPSGIAKNLGEVAVDPVGGGVAYVYFDLNTGEIQVAHDRSGDGDFGDSPGGNPEFHSPVTLATNATCLGAGFATDGDLVAVWSDGVNGLIFARDFDADGDLSGVGEIVTLDAASPAACGVSGGAGLDVSVAWMDGTDARLAVDRNDDGDFADATELVSLGTFADVAQIAVSHRDDGTVFVALVKESGGGFVVSDTNP